MATLLGLPAELRNRIYEYTLTDVSPIGLLHRPYFIDQEQWAPILLTSSGSIYNVLKYVCRQLRAETSGLDLEYNAILIDDGKHAPIRRLHTFCKSEFDMRCSPQFRGFVSSKVSSRPWQNAADLAEWCAARPKVRVHYRLKGFQPGEFKLPKDATRWNDWQQGSAAYNAAAFIMDGVYLTILLRGQQWSPSEWFRLGFGFIGTGMTRENRMERMETVAKWSRDEWDVDMHGKVVNLKLFPTGRGFDHMKGAAVECLARESLASDEVRDEWMAMCREWYTVGI